MFFVFRSPWICENAVSRPPLFIRDVTLRLAPTRPWCAMRCDDDPGLENVEQRVY